MLLCIICIHYNFMRKYNKTHQILEKKKKETSFKRKEVIDIAIGDGSLSSVVYLAIKTCVLIVIAIDISEEMLSKQKINYTISQ